MGIYVADRPILIFACGLVNMRVQRFIIVEKMVHWEFIEITDTFADAGRKERRGVDSGKCIRNASRTDGRYRIC
jgi:hypothetical protein